MGAFGFFRKILGGVQALRIVILLEKKSRFSDNVGCGDAQTLLDDKIKF